MVTVSREKFDQFLVREAEKAGAFFWTGIRFSLWSPKMTPSR